jgi:L-asparaginase
LKLQILTTGGTIDKLYFDDLSEFQVGDPQIVEFLREANVDFEFEVAVLFQKDSLDLTDDDRAKIRAAVVASPYRQVLITHGTDTMTTTAASLDGIPDKTIVLTGSITPARFRASDAAFNIGYAIAAAQRLPTGVYLAMNGRVFDPDKVQKTLARVDLKRHSLSKSA